MSLVMLRLDPALTLLALGVCRALLIMIARLNARISAAPRAQLEESQVYSVVQQAMA